MHDANAAVHEQKLTKVAVFTVPTQITNAVST